MAFHQSIVGSTRNPQIIRLSRDWLTQVSLGFPVESYDSDPAVYERALTEHTTLCEAITVGDEQCGRDRPGPLRHQQRGGTRGPGPRPGIAGRPRPRTLTGRAARGRAVGGRRTRRSWLGARGKRRPDRRQPAR
ncbi:hypothetical protein AB0C27_54735 [Nonomuraea sp. NPDC048882]|uniref:hypothetical protein n=1 Tax=Nonomuraea sp. NPDC048882 TaxID=3154347 RepID=UPI0033F34C79